MPWFACRKLNSDFGMILATSASRILASYMRVSGIWSHTNPSKTAFVLYLVVVLYTSYTSTKLYTLGRSVESHTASASTQKYQNLNLRKPKFTEIWFKVHGVYVIWDPFPGRMEGRVIYLVYKARSTAGRESNPPVGHIFKSVYRYSG